MADVVIARVVHVLAVVLWIGGVGMVTTVLLPTIRRSWPAEQRFAVFHNLEKRFANQARVTTALVGISGLYMVWRLDAWSWFEEANFWWMDAMLFVWLLFTLMLFVIEPLFLEQLLARCARSAPEETFRAVEWLHRVLLLLSLVTVAGAVAGSQGANLLAW